MPYNRSTLPHTISCSADVWKITFVIKFSFLSQVPESIFVKEKSPPPRKVEAKDPPQKKEQPSQQAKEQPSQQAKEQPSQQAVKTNNTRPHTDSIPAEKLPIQNQVEVHIMYVVHPNKFTVVETKNMGKVQVIGEKMMVVS